MSVQTKLTFQGEQVLINGRLTYESQPAEGLLYNLRTVNATFDDTLGRVGCWDDNGSHPENGYAGYGQWHSPASAFANTARFIAALAQYKASGVLAVNLNFQGGHPAHARTELAWANQSANTGPNGQRDYVHNSGFRADGTIDPNYAKRLADVIDACAQLGMAVILGLFYFGQDTIFPDEKGILAATDSAVDFVCRQEWQHVLIEIANEVSNGHYHHEILKPARIAELIERVRQRAADKYGRRLLVSTSEAGFSNVKQWSEQEQDCVFSASDFVLLHGGDGRAAGPEHDYTAQVEKTRYVRSRPWFKARPRPIIYNEINHAGGFDATWKERVSFGLHSSKYLQNVWPARWGVWDNEIKWFFERVKEVTGERET